MAPKKTTKRKRGRPKGSKNKVKRPKRKVGRPKKRKVGRPKGSKNKTTRRKKVTFTKKGVSKRYKRRKNYQTGTSSRRHDLRYKAKKVGKRKSASGKIYYERRANRSDKRPSKYL